MSWLFAVGAAVGLADDHDGTAGLAGLVSYLMMTSLLSVTMPSTVECTTASGEVATAVIAASGVPITMIASLANNEVSMLAFSKDCR